MILVRYHWLGLSQVISPQKRSDFRRELLAAATANSMEWELLQPLKLRARATLCERDNALVIGARKEPWEVATAIAKAVGL